MTLPLDASMGLPDAARHAPRVCSENWTKEVLYMRLGAPCALHEAGQPSHTFNAAIDGGVRSQMLANGWAHAPSLARSAQLTLAFGHPVSSHGQGPPSTTRSGTMSTTLASRARYWRWGVVLVSLGGVMSAVVTPKTAERAGDDPLVLVTLSR